MENNILYGILINLFPFAIIGIVAFTIVSFLGKYNKIKKLKSGEIASHEIKGIVSEIKYRTGGRNQSTITSWYFIAKGTDTGSNEEMEFESENFPYKDTWFKIRFMGPNQEDEDKLLQYARGFIKEGDVVKIHISNENKDIYYIQDITKSDGTMTETNNILQGTGPILGIFGLGSSNNSLIGNGLKKARGFIFLIVILFIGPIIVSLVSDSGSGFDLNLAKINRGINLDFGGSKLVWILLTIILLFVIIKIGLDYFKKYKK